MIIRTRCAPILVGAFYLLGVCAAFARPTVFWASDPVKPDETALVIGDELPPATFARISLMLDSPSAISGTAQAVDVPLLHVSPTSVKFVIPKDFPEGIYHVAIGVPGASDRLDLNLNAPTVYWLQGDRGNDCTPGSTLRIFGRNVSRGSNTTLRLDRIGEPANRIDLHASSASLWEVSFVVPGDVAPGDYSVRLWNGQGDATTWTQASVISVQSRPDSSTRQLSAKDFGARGDGVADDTASIVRALTVLGRQGGGTLRLPRGYYRVSEGLVIPPGVRISGEDRALVRLIWPDFSNPPYSLMQGSSDFAVEDVTIVAGNHAHILSGGFASESNVGLSDAKNIFIRRLTVRASSYKGHLTPDQVAQRFQASLKFSTGGPDTLRLSGTNLVVEDCDLFASGRSLYLQQPKGAHIARNKFYNGRLGWYSISGADRVVFERNEIIGGDLQSTGGGINTLGNNPFAQNVAFLRNHFHMLNGWDREAVTSDGPSGCYYGAVTNVSKDRRIVVLPELSLAAPRDLSRCLGAGLFVLTGKGAGQVQRVESIDGSQVRLTEPFAVAPDETSIVSMTTLQRHYLIIGNEFSDVGTSVQFFGSSLGHVVAENIAHRTTGFLARGLHYVQFQPAWYNQFLRNAIVEGDLTKEAIIGTWGSQQQPNEAPLSLGTIIRSNVLDGGAHIEIKGFSKKAPGVKDVIVEDNQISHGAQPAILVDDGVIGILLRKNVVDGVLKPTEERFRH